MNRRQQAQVSRCRRHEVVAGARERLRRGDAGDVRKPLEMGRRRAALVAGPRLVGGPPSRGEKLHDEIQRSPARRHRPLLPGCTPCKLERVRIIARRAHPITSGTCGLWRRESHSNDAAGLQVAEIESVVQGEFLPVFCCGKAFPPLLPPALELRSAAASGSISGYAYGVKT